MRAKQIAERVTEWGGYAKAAQRAKLNPGTLYHLANGTRRPTRRQLRRLGLWDDDKQVVAFHLPKEKAARFCRQVARLADGRENQADAICDLIDQCLNSEAVDAVAVVVTARAADTKEKRDARNDT